MDNRPSGNVGAPKSTAQQSITPDTKPGFVKPGGIAGAAANAANALKKVENGIAEEAPAEAEDDLDSARDGEEGVDDVNYTGGGREEAAEGGGGFFSNHKGFVGGVVGIVLLFVGIIFGGQSTQLVSLVENLRSGMNTMQTSAATRSNSLIRYQLDNGTLKNPIKSRLFLPDKFKISDKQRQKLARNGIDVETENGRTIMKFNDADGNMKVIVADASDVDTFRGKYGDNVLTFRDAFDTNDNFFKAYKDASLTWRGAVANWFETTTDRFLRVNKLNRNATSDYKSKLEENDGNPQKAVSSMLSEGTDEINDGGSRFAKIGKETDEDGNTEGKIRNSTNGNNIDDVDKPELIKRSSIKSESDVKARLNKLKSRYTGDTGSGISGKVQMVTNILCTVSNFLGGVSLLVAANNVLQATHVALGYLEAGDKIKAGNADESTNAMLNVLNTSTTEENKILGANTDAVSTLEDNIMGMIGAMPKEKGEEYPSFLNTKFSDEQSAQIESYTESRFKVEKYNVTGTAMNSNAILSLFSGSKINPDDPSVRMFNFQRNFHTIAGALGVSMGAFYTCAAAKMFANVAGVAENILTTGGCIAGAAAAPLTFGISAIVGCMAKIGDITMSIGIGVAAAFVIGGIIAAITPVVAQLFTKNFSEMIGVNLGTIIYDGSHSVMGMTHHANGGSLMTKDEFTTFSLNQQQVIAEEAKYDRMNRSPFDITSQNTFLGSLVRKLGLFGQQNSIMGVITSSGSILQNSISAISPTASAISLSNQLYDNYDEICPDLASIGAVGSAACIPYEGSDMSTMNMNPSDEVVAKLAEDSSFMMESDGTAQADSEGNLIIDASSDLAKYIKYCVNRTSSFGVADANIIASIGVSAKTESTALNNVINSTVGAIPVVGDAVDAADAIKTMANAEYVTGQACVAGSSSNWEKAKYYQRFIEDQSLMESMGIIEKSAVTAFLEEEDKKNPIDNSYEGMLARYSGMDKEDVIAILDVLEYYDYIANYDPSTRYAFVEREAPARELKFDNDQKVAYAILLNDIEFADVRNRNFVV